MAWEVLSALIQGGGAIIAAKIVVDGGLKGLENWRSESNGRRKLELAEECIILSEDLPKEIWSLRSANYLMIPEIPIGTAPWEMKEVVRMDEAFDKKTREIQAKIDHFTLRSKYLSIYAGANSRIAGRDYNFALSTIQQQHRNAREVVMNSDANKEEKWKAFRDFTTHSMEYEESQKLREELNSIHNSFENLFVLEMRVDQRLEEARSRRQFGASLPAKKVR